MNKFAPKAIQVLILFTLVAGPLLPLFSKPVNAATLNDQSVEVCFINFDKNGTILQSLPGNTSIGIKLFSNSNRLKEGVINSYGSEYILIEQTYQPVNTDLLGGDNIADSYCLDQNFTKPENQQYLYSPATISSNLQWLPVRYNDQNNIDFVDLDIAFPYSNEWFDNILGNESIRNTNSDGHIVMSSDRSKRRLLIVSEQDKNLPKYAVNFNDSTPSNQEYTLSNIPQTIITGKSINLRFNVQNMGELVWLPGDNPNNSHPVNVSYHWKSKTSGEYLVYDGNRAIINHPLAYTENDSNISLQVVAPTVPRDYELIIDMVHEGVTWFSAQGASTYVANIEIIEDQSLLSSPQRSLIDITETQRHSSLSIAASGSYYTVKPYQGGNWHCGGYDCLSGIAEEFYQCSSRGIPNDAMSGDMTQKCWWPIYEANKSLFSSVYSSTPWDYIQVGWTLYIPPFNGGTTIPPTPVNATNFGGVAGATTYDPYAGMYGSWSAWPKVTFDRWISWNGEYKTDAIKWSETTRPQSPTITGIQTSIDGKSATIFGVAIPKNHPMDIAVWNEYRHCWACGSGWDYHYQRGTAQHVKIVLFKNNWEYIGQVWNDRPDGRWSTTLSLGSNLKPGDRVFAEVQIEADYTFSGLRWWTNTYESPNFNLRNPKYTGYPYFGSGGGNSIVIPSIFVDPRSIEERGIDQLASIIGSSGGSNLTNICGYPAKTYSNTYQGNSGAIFYVNGRAVYTYGGTWETYQYYPDRCNRFGVPINNPNSGGTGPFNTAGAYQDFSRSTEQARSTSQVTGRIYWSWKHLGKFTYGSIWSKYEQAGGTNSMYGWPTSETYSTIQNGQTNTCQNFEGGVICEQDIVDPTIQRFLNAEQTYSNVNRLGDIHDWCGTKIQDYNQIGSYGRSSLILNPNNNQIYLLTGGLAYTYFTNGACHTFGFPTNNPGNTAEGNGWWQEFSGSTSSSGSTTIYWHRTDTRAQGKWVTGAMRDYHNSLGGSASYLGFPVGMQWSETSYCGVSGEMQHFQNGKGFRSDIDSTWIEYGGWFDLPNKYGVQGVNGLGWPKGRPFNKGLFWWNAWSFERGELQWDHNIDYILEGIPSCSITNQRQNDPFNSSTNAIHAAEDQLFNAYQRTAGLAGIPHEYCGGAIVDYDAIRLKDNSTAEKSWIIYNPATGQANLLYGYIAEKYWQNGNCEKFGLTTGNPYDIEGMRVVVGTTELPAFEQKFQKANIVAYQKPNNIGTIGGEWVSYWSPLEFAQFQDKYRETNYLGSFGLLTSDPIVGISSCNKVGIISRYEYGEIHNTDFRTHLVTPNIYREYLANGGFQKFGLAIGSVFARYDNWLTTYSQNFTNGYVNNTPWGLGINFDSSENNLACWQNKDNSPDLTLADIYQKAQEGDRILNVYYSTYPALNELMQKGLREYTNKEYAEQIVRRAEIELESLSKFQLMAILLDGASALEPNGMTKVDTDTLVKVITKTSENIQLRRLELTKFIENNQLRNEFETLLRLDYELGINYAETSFYETEVANISLEATLTGSSLAVLANPEAFLDGLVNQCLSLACVQAGINSLKVWEWLPAIGQLFQDPTTLSLMLASAEAQTRYKMTEKSFVDEEGNTVKYLDYVLDPNGQPIENSSYDRARKVGAYVADSIASAIVWAGVGSGVSYVAGKGISLLQSSIQDLINQLNWMKALPNSATRNSITTKLLTYLLEINHPEGGAKAKWFKEALGFTQNNYMKLARQLVFDESKASITKTSAYGIQYNQVHTIIGANGKIIDVIFGWIRDNDNLIRLVTAIPTSK